MKKITKRLMAVVLCVAVLAGVAAFVASASGKEATIVFDASTKQFTINNIPITISEKGVQNEGETGTRKYPDLFPEMKNLMPGDRIEQTIKVQVKNAGSDTVKLYLKADDASADDDRDPTNDDYDKLMRYRTEKGEGDQQADQGEKKQYYADTLTYTGELTTLAENAEESGTDGVYLGAYTGENPDPKTLTVSLAIPLEAGNEIQGLTAKIGWVIKAEIIPSGGGNPGGGGGTDPGGTDIPDEPTPGVDLDLTNHFAYIIGRKDGLIHPEAQITRGEVATIFFRMLTDDTRNALWSTTNSYTDVPENLWCNNAISTLTNGGILKGYKDGSFRAGEPITRAEFATMAVRFFQVTYDGPNQFSDIDGHWAADYINCAAAAGIILGYQDGTFRPDLDITRAQAIVIINRVLQRHPDKDHLLDDMITWPDNMDTSAWYYADVQEATNSHDYDMLTNKKGEDYEIWTELQPVRDWAAFETEWATANSAPNPGNVYTSSKSTKN